MAGFAMFLPIRQENTIAYFFHRRTGDVCAGSQKIIGSQEMTIPLLK